ncbi:MAG: hypothetical protein LQ345_003517 [Seirophora villosa]|nr:MAG: hypothetical protein LQ345_003517 [Seirophora villosa]
MDVLVEEPEVSASANTTAAAVPLPRPRAENTSQASTRDTSSREPLQISNDSYGRLPRRRAADPAIILQIEAIVGQMFDSLQKQEDGISISLRTKRAPNPSSSQTSARSSKDYYKISFPGRSPQEAKRFSRAALVEAVCNRTSSMLICSPAIVLRILELIHEALVADIVISKRNIYYKDPELFQSQKIVDRYVDILAYTFGIQRAALNVAKGYPDISTRALLRLLFLSSYPPPRIYALVDFDPDGIAIMSTYKHGSFTLSHENANLKTPTIRWLGVKSEDLPINNREGGWDDSERTGFLRLCRQDRKKAVKILGKEHCNEDGPEYEWRRELQTMLMLNIKVEMEILSERKGGLEKWVEERLLQQPSGNVSKGSDFWG